VTPLPSAKSHGRWSRASTAWQFSCLALLCGVIGLTGVRLFTGITRVGMNGIDTFEYWKYANEILHGRVDFLYDRLAFYAVNVAALKFIGINDYAIRAVIDGLALVNIALVYLLGWLIARNAVVAVAIATLFAFNPTILNYAATELPHVTGATFVLLCALFALPASDQSAPLRTRLIGSFIVGATLAGAALTHEDLAFLGFGYALAIAVPAAMPEARATPPASRRRDLLLALGSLALGAAVSAAALMLAFGIGPVKILRDFFQLHGQFDENTVLRTGGAFFKTVTLRMIKNFTVDTMGRVITAFAVVLGLVVPAAFVLRRRDRTRMLLTLEIPVLVYVVCFLGIAQIYLEGTYQRIFIPLIGPTLAFTFCGTYLLLQARLRDCAAAIVFAWAAYVSINNKVWDFAPPAVSLHRQLYDALKDRVTSERKLLLPACYAIYTPWVGVGSQVYLGDNVVPIYLMRDLVSLDALIATDNIGFVYVPGVQLPGMWPRERIEQLFVVTYGVPMDPAILRDLPRVSQEVWRGDTKVSWTEEACAFEAQVLRRLLSERGARLVATAPGEIYELPRPGAAVDSERR
jgi:hypothetical protein